jgi:hypothetical protein
MYRYIVTCHVYKKKVIFFHLWQNQFFPLLRRIEAHSKPQACRKVLAWPAIPCFRLFNIRCHVSCLCYHCASFTPRCVNYGVVRCVIVYLHPQLAPPPHPSTRLKGFPLQAWCRSWRSRRLRLLDRLDFQHYEGGKVVTLMHRPPLPPGIFLVLIFRGWVDPRADGSVGSFGKNLQRHHCGSIPRPAD